MQLTRTQSQQEAPGCNLHQARYDTRWVRDVPRGRDGASRDAHAEGNVRGRDVHAGGDAHVVATVRKLLGAGAPAANKSLEVQAQHS